MIYHPCSAEKSRKSGALTYLEPLGPLRPVAGHIYFTLTVNGDNFTEEQIKEGIDLGSKAYCASQKILKSKRVSKKAKLNLYWTIIRCDNLSH
jgi:uncharacterized OsmC-like protein